MSSCCYFHVTVTLSWFELILSEFELKTVIFLCNLAKIWDVSFTQNQLKFTQTQLKFTQNQLKFIQDQLKFTGAGGEVSRLFVLGSICECENCIVLFGLQCLTHPNPRYWFDVYKAFDEISRQIKKVVGATPSDYLVATPTARKLDQMQFSRKRKLEYQAET